MSLNNIVLQPSLLADLYASSLIENSATQMPVSITSGYTGKFEKKILIITADKNNPVITSSDLDLLNGILKACSLYLDDVAIINFFSHESSHTGLQEQAEFVLLFGIDPLTLGLPINFPFYQLQTFNKRTYLYAPSLPEIGGDRNIKASLWTSLKKLFDL